MADEKKKGEGDEEEGKGKGGMMPLILVAVGAALGGGGVVMFSGPPEVTHENHEAKKKYVVVEHPDEQYIVFNPQSKRGSRTGRVRFYYSYLIEKGFEVQATDSIRDHQRAAFDRCASALRALSTNDLKTDRGVEALRLRLKDELERTLFPEVPNKEGKMVRIATIYEVNFSEIFVQ